MKRLIAMGVAGVVSVVGAVAVAASSAVAGGWAVTTLDSVPAPGVNEKVEVGFTIRQHGVTPVRPEGDVGIQITSESRVSSYFAAEPNGPTGHYVATVIFPEAGTFTWLARQGWFEPQPLGTVVVGSGHAVGADNSAGGKVSSSIERYRWPIGLRIGLLVAAVGLLAFSLWDAIGGTRRTRPTTAS